MDYNHISKLLERYFEGETTLEEEKQLRQYFVEGPVAEQHQPYQDLFCFFVSGQEYGYQSETVPLSDVVSEKVPVNRRFRIQPVFWRAAAIAAIAMSAWWLYPETETDVTAIDWSQYEPATPEEAFSTTSRALKSASVKLNYGAKKAAQKVSEVQRVF